MDGLSIIIPAYNEEAGIELVLQQLKAEMSTLSYLVEIVVVDDGSEDNTAALAQANSADRVIQHRGNRGYGAALKTGIRSAAYDLICITDADGTYPNQRIPDLVEKLVSDDLDMVIGARVSGKVAIPLVRRPAKWMLSKLAQLVVGEKIPDLNSGLRVFRKSLALGFFNLIPDGFSFTTTLTLATLSNGYLVEYVPIEYFARVGRSKIRPVRDTFNFIQLVLRIALYFAPLKIFLPISGVLMLLAIGWGAFSGLVLGRIADASTAAIAMTAIEIAVIGLLAELIDRRLPGYHKDDER